jgi:zinc protease
MKKLGSYTLNDVKKWLTPELTKGYLELSVVGDFEIEKILPDLLATFGALSARTAIAPPLPESRKVKFPNAPASKAFPYDSKIKQGTAIALWKTAGLRGNSKEVRRLNLLSEILGDRLRVEIREKLGASYSPHAAVDGSETLDDMGFVMSQSIGKPDDLVRLLETMREQADNLATKGASDDELDRARKPTMSMIEKSNRDNRYWLETVLRQSQLDSKRLDRARTRDADYASITLAEINAMAKKYLAAEHAIFVTIKPEE